MARYNKTENAETQSAESKTLEVFTNLIIQKIQSLTSKEAHHKFGVMM